EATRAISAHFSLAAISIVVAEPEVGAVLGGLDGEQAIRANAAVAVAKMGDLIAVELEGEIAVVDDDEVVAGTVHFVEVKEHRMPIGDWRLPSVDVRKRAWPRSAG